MRQQVLAPIERALRRSKRFFAFRYAEIELATSLLATYSSGSPAFTRVPVSATMRVIGPLTWVIACVVWSLSQSTVPVVRTSVDHVVFRTGTIFKCGSCSAGTVKNDAVAVPPAAAFWAPLSAAAVVDAGGAGLLVHAESIAAAMTVKPATLIAIPAFQPPG